MPVYEYRCQEGHQYERWESFEAPTEQPCPYCAGVARRLLSRPAIIFKGPGFYSTDNRRDGSRPVGDKEETSAETKSEASD